MKRICICNDIHSLLFAYKTNSISILTRNTYINDYQHIIEVPSFISSLLDTTFNIETSEGGRLCYGKVGELRNKVIVALGLKGLLPFHSVAEDLLLNDGKIRASFRALRSADIPYDILFVPESFFLDGTDVMSKTEKDSIILDLFKISGSRKLPFRVLLNTPEPIISCCFEGSVAYVLSKMKSDKVADFDCSWVPIKYHIANMIQEQYGIKIGIEPISRTVQEDILWEVHTKPGLSSIPRNTYECLQTLEM